MLTTENMFSFVCPMLKNKITWLVIVSELPYVYQYCFSLQEILIQHD